MIKKIVTPLLTYLCAFSLLAPQTSFCAATDGQEPVPAAQTAAPDRFELSEKAKMLMLILGGGTIVSLGESISAYRKAKKRGTLPVKINSYWGFLKKRFHNAVFKPQDSFKAQPLFSSAIYLSSFLLVSKALEPSREPVQKEAELHVPQERLTDIQTGYPERTAEIQRLGRQVNHLNQEIMEKIITLPTRATPTQPFNAASFDAAFNTHQHSTRVKNRILETLLRNQALGNTATPPIFCLVGAPGVGKTTIASSVARALGREFQAIALGGNGDSHTIKGWVRTYQSPQPGEIINALIRSGVTNPVILLDEIDKLCENHTGNPAATLLEVLDPAQNNRFKDAYINIPVDLSQVFFIATANDWDAIPEALQSRLTRIDLASYSAAEKAEIVAQSLTTTPLFQQAILGTTFITELVDAFDNAPSGMRRVKQLMEQADGFYLRLRLTDAHVTYDSFKDAFFAHLRNEQAAQQQP